MLYHLIRSMDYLEALYKGLEERGFVRCTTSYLDFYKDSKHQYRPSITSLCFDRIKVHRVDITSGYEGSITRILVTDRGYYDDEGFKWSSIDDIVSYVIRTGRYIDSYYSNLCEFF